MNAFFSLILTEKAAGHPLRDALLFYLGNVESLCQTHSNLNAFNEARLFVLSAEGANCIDDLIDLVQWLPVHEPVELLEVGFDGCVIEAAGFVIGIEQHLQDSLRIVGIVAAGWPDGFGGQS